MPSNDPKFERALAQHLRGGSSQANCPDAETLAAYHERNLSLEEMAKWKQHISACEACQEALALVETTENQLAEDWEKQGIPVLEAASIPGVHAGSIPKRSAKSSVASAPQAAAAPVAINRRRPPLLRWAIPLGAVAAGVLVFIGLFELRAPNMRRAAKTEMAQNQAPAAPRPSLDEAKKVQPQFESRDERLPAAEMSRKKSEQGLTSGLPAKPAAKAKDSGDEPRQSRDQLAGGRLEMTPAPALSPRTPPRSATDAAVSENEHVIASAPRPAPPSASKAYGNSVAGAAGGPPARADAKIAVPSASQTVTVESAAAAQDTQTNTMLMKQGISNKLAEATNSAAGLILTPDNKVFWKLQPAGTLQLTTDGGKKWKSLDTGVNANLTAGFAPSSRVCWIAGKAGTLLLTTDHGGHWTRINTPITGDLGGVHAADAKHASIWDAANHVSYETSDGGATWKQTANE
jgi:hypothetical protein